MLTDGPKKRFLFFQFETQNVAKTLDFIEAFVDCRSRWELWIYSVESFTANKLLNVFSLSHHYTLFSVSLYLRFMMGFFLTLEY